MYLHKIKANVSFDSFNNKAKIHLQTWRAEKGTGKFYFIFLYLIYLVRLPFKDGKLCRHIIYP